MLHCRFVEFYDHCRCFTTIQKANIENWVIFSTTCIHRLNARCTAKPKRAIAIIIPLWKEIPTEIWDKRSSVAGHLSEEVCSGNIHFFGQLSKGHSWPVPSGDDRNKWKPFKVWTTVLLGFFFLEILVSIQAGRINKLPDLTSFAIN